MGNPLRDRCSAAELASNGQVIEIAEDIGSFNQLAEIVEADLAALDSDIIPVSWRARTVTGELQFGFADSEARFPAVTGRAAVEVDSVCQRCLEPFRLGLSIEPRLLLLNEQEATDLFEDFEVWELDERTLRPQDIVEELLIMALPFSAKHDNMADCKALSTTSDVSSKMRRPFAALASQMKQIEEDPDS